ncbi:SDR family oxidoreductase [Lentibacillus sediminis]|uniref:SDR family oxidoreductase n=1 Tax=Lentibacillus sediminis TaxID=1940529 RepID=UPI000C1C2106|nr:SDR family oxidoreductase [Lentibacillus sediminis]
MKTAIVTGANSGMGLATTIDLARKGIHVVMACRNEEKGKTALEEARKKSRTPHIDMMLLDLASLQSVRDFVDEFKTRYDRLDIIINNAGVVTPKRAETKDGFELEMGVNHLGHFLLTNLLLEQLKESEDGRIVIISSGAHKWGNIHFDDPHMEKGFNIFKGYGQSKLANVLFMKELDKRLRTTNVTVNAVHPGAVSTGLGIDRETGFGKGIVRLLRPFFQTPAEGANTAVHLAVDSHLRHLSGKYFHNHDEAAVSKRAEDEMLARRLWEWSVREVGLGE